MNSQLTFFLDAQGEQRASLEGSWRSDLSEELQDSGVTILMLSRTAGFQADSLDFLAELKFLTGLIVIDGSIRDVAGVEQLPSLRYLELRTYAKRGPDLTRCPELRTCHIDWIPGADSVYDCAKLEKLEIWRFPAGDMRHLESLRSLRYLSISQGSKLRSSAGLENCTELVGLSLAYLPHLHKLDAISQLHQLGTLSIETCRHVNDLDFVATLANLHTLVIGNCGDVSSLAPLMGLSGLEQVEFWESTNVRDGDLSVLLALPRLAEARFRDRRHYSHTSEDVAKHIKARRA